MNRRLFRNTFLYALSAFGVPLLRPRAGVLAAETYTLRLNQQLAATSAIGVAASRFAAGVERRSNGQLKVEVYPNGQLAKEQESSQSLISGVVDLAIQSTAFLVGQFPRFQVFDLPFLFKNLEGGFRLLDGSLGDDFFADLDAKGIVGLGWGGVFKQFETTSKPIVVPDDMKGLRFRSQSSAIPTTTYQTLGAIPVAIDYAEIYTALSQHAIDGLDVNLDGFVTGKFYTVAKHVAISNHVFSVNVLLGAKRKIESLPPALQRAIKVEAKVAIPFWRSLYTQQVAEADKTLRSSGIVFTEIQYPAFRKAVEPVYANYRAKIGGDLIDRIAAAAG